MKNLHFSDSISPSRFVLEGNCAHSPQVKFFICGSAGKKCQMQDCRRKIETRTIRVWYHMLTAVILLIELVILSVPVLDKYETLREIQISLDSPHMLKGANC